MIDIFSLAGYDNKAQCPICSSASIDGTGFLIGAKECSAKCLAPYRTAFNYGNGAWGNLENKLIIIQIFKEDDHNACLDLINKQVRVYKDWMNIFKINIDYFKVPEVKSEIWNKIETLMVFQ